MHRKLITHVAVFVVGTAVGIGGVAIASGGGLSEWHGHHDSPVVHQLKKANEKLTTICANTGARC